MKISEIYLKYKIPQILQIHMFRVTSVASLICKNFSGKIDANSVLQACLLHDMGNIVKFNMSFMPEAFDPEGVEYWTKIKEEFIEKYGSNEHKVTQKILGELGVSNEVKRIISSIGFSKVKAVYESKVFEAKVCLYSDQRVMPKSIASLDARIEEGYKRFLNRRDWPQSVIDEFPILAEYHRKIEKEIFKHCRIKPEDINNKAVVPIIKELQDFDIVTN